jgi:catechol 2,3-dioxygenase-like lactoylglutathione lyase family enzyme
MSQNRPPATGGIRHVALFVKNLEETCQFYVELMGMEIEWQPDPDNIYLTSGNDNLALHRKDSSMANDNQRLDHIGFIIEYIEQVDEWYEFLCSHNVKILQAIKTHRDGARSFYCADPSGTAVQIIYHPPISLGGKKG